ncbi:uncharacterized protein [Drosophila virilis]|uniref:Uncharacterized protein n=1 Tax=Drosophila virilis TaxID=7244 RepID=B4MFE0_DROVI|nr:uncharacterized protein LOC6636421 [Drosophila virilis]EDW57309.2 uncharacterized protein Dvir_GJ14947 [Drosophila virilis]
MNKILGNWYVAGECRAPGLLSPVESEILSASDKVEFGEEEPDLDLAYDQLEAIKRRLKQLQANLIYPPADPCELTGTSRTASEDNGSLTDNQVMLQQLRRSNSKLRCQLRLQAQHLQSSRKHLRLLEDMRCQLGNRLRQMSAQLDEFEQFKRSAQHQAGLCIERNEQIKATKIDKQNFLTQLSKLNIHYTNHMRLMAPLRCHNQLRYDLSLDLILTRIFLHALFGNMVEDWKFCIRRLKKNCRGVRLRMLPPTDFPPIWPWRD